MLPIVDANVVLRYLLADDKKQFERAKKLIENGCELTVEVLAEVVYVLSGRYQVPRTDIASSLEGLLNLVFLERADEVVYALRLFANKKLDFVDCLLVAAHAVSGREIATFDKGIAKLI